MQIRYSLMTFLAFSAVLCSPLTIRRATDDVMGSIASVTDKRGSKYFFTAERRASDLLLKTPSPVLRRAPSSTSQGGLPSTTLSDTSSTPSTPSLYAGSTLSSSSVSTSAPLPQLLFHMPSPSP